jgi:hypothetical protein
MILVPRQLMRSGMTGTVPYYGGRSTPAQAYAASHPAPPRPPVRPQTDSLAALDHLRDTGVLTADEYDRCLRRLGR